MKRYTQKISHFLVFLLLFNIAAAASVSAVPFNSASLDGNDRILVCTSRGYQWISLADLSSESSIPDSQSASFHDCSFCRGQLQAFDDFAVSVVLDFSSLQQQPVVYSHNPVVVFLPFYTSRTSHPRAPPVA